MDWVTSLLHVRHDRGEARPAASRAAALARCERTMRAGATPCISRISRATTWQAKSKQPARDKSWR
eukprot:2690692-Lingulodinium_polyedra.AAC.1